MEKLMLDTDKIERLKKLHGYTYDDLARKMGLNSRQHVYDYIKHKRIAGAVKFAEIFGVDPKDLIK
jgi:transcriptional regulator with XRE-family HTH domain